MTWFQAVRCHRPRSWLTIAFRGGGVLAWWLAWVALGGCTPTLSTMEPARLAPPGHVQVVASANGTLPTGEPMSQLRGLQRVSKSEQLNYDTAQTLALGTASLMVNAPGVTSNAAISVGLSRDWELSSRVSPSAARLAVRHQLFRLRPGFYGVVGLGFTQYFAPLDFEAFTTRAKVNHFSRTELDIPLHLGISGRVGHLWGGPKLIVTRYDADVSACLSASHGTCATQGRMTMNGRATYVGGQVGVAVGYRRLWLGVELTAMRLDARANLDVDVAGIKTRLPFSPDGWMLSPAVGLITWW